MHTRCRTMSKVPARLWLLWHAQEKKRVGEVSTFSWNKIHWGGFKCSHSQNSKALKSTDCWPAPREQSPYGHKLTWIFFLVSVKQIQSWSFSKHCRYTPYIYRPQTVLQGVFGARLAVLTRAERTVTIWQWNTFIQNVTHILEPALFSPSRNETSRRSNLTVLAYRVILPRIFGSRQCRGEFC